MLYMPNTWIRPRATRALRFKYIDSLIFDVRMRMKEGGIRKEKKVEGICFRPVSL